MQALDLLLNRYSSSRLQAPAPKADELETILKAGLRAPDHGNLTPWKFIISQDVGIEKLSQIFEAAAQDANESEEDQQRAKLAPFRAPLIITVVSTADANAKIPVIEQNISTGCTVHAMEMAAYSLGYGSMWRTGKWAYNSFINSALNLKESDQIIGFLYIGSRLPRERKPDLPHRPLENYVEYLG